MRARIHPVQPSHRPGATPPRVLVAAAALLIPALCASAFAQRHERSGQEVTEAVCAACHAAGINGAPRIGDAKAWAPRAAQGLTSLTAHAISGIRNMPAHGGSPATSDGEIERAITYMVNQSGGHWIEPLGAATSAAVRSSEQIVRTQCSKCHQTGENGAPKIGDRAAWIPRLRRGLDTLVASAIHGHGAMPARGGLPDLSAEEIRGAIAYMFNFGVAMPPVTVAAPARPADPYHKLVDGTDVYLGMISADAMRSAQPQGGPGGAAAARIPSGKGVYHLNISLTDSKSNASITDAEVTATVSDAMATETHPLELGAVGKTFSYGGFFRLQRGTPYTITAKIQRPGVSVPIEAKFDYKLY